jgi:seryl-tRNA synthetase
MLDIKQIRDNPGEVKRRLMDKGADFNAEIDRILELDQIRRDLIYKTESLKSEQNKVSKQIPAMKRSGEDTAPVFAKMKELSETVKQTDSGLRKAEEEYQELLLGLPQPAGSGPEAGGKENNDPLVNSARRMSLIFRRKTMWIFAQI